MPTYVMPAVLPVPDTNVPADSTLPGLRGLAKLADLRPVIVAMSTSPEFWRRRNSRICAMMSSEQDPLVFIRLQAVPGTAATIEP
jgi:hypothetical protein